jgi:hypothetical protein
MKVILALFALCLFGFTLAAGQNPPPPASGPVGPAGPVVADDPPPPPAKAPISKPPRISTGPNGPVVEADSRPAAPLPKYEKWFAFESPAGGFSVKFPAKPVSNPGIPAPNVSGLLRYVTALNAGAGRYFEVDYYDYKGHLNSPEFARTASLTAMIAAAGTRNLEAKARRSFANGRCQIDEATLGPKSTGPLPILLLMKIRVLYSGDKLYILLGNSLGDNADAKAVDQFLDSFIVNGGCVDAIGSATAKTTKGTDAGTLDAATGWQRFETTYGISFLLPTEAQTEDWEDNALGKNFIKFMYLSSINGVTFSVEALNAFPLPDAKDTVRAANVLDSNVIQLRTNIAKDNFVLGTCTPQMAGTVMGRECSVTHTNPDLRGRARIFVTPKWTFVLMALRETETTDQSAEDRFFNSVTINDK